MIGAALMIRFAFQNFFFSNFYKGEKSVLIKLLYAKRAKNRGAFRSLLKGSSQCFFKSLHGINSQLFSVVSGAAILSIWLTICQIGK